MAAVANIAMALVLFGGCAKWRLDYAGAAEGVQAAITEATTSQELGGPDGRLVRMRLDPLEAREKTTIICLFPNSFRSFQCGAGEILKIIFIDM
jgi:hypothetical protein